MPTLKNPRWELFVVNRSEGMPIGRSYMAAGFKVKDVEVAYVCGSRLLRNALVKARLRELIEIRAETIIVTRETIAAEIDQAVELAHQLGQPAAAIAGGQAKARLYGVEAPSRSVNLNISGSFNALTEDELGFELASMINEVRAAAGKVPVALPAPVEKKH